MSRVGKKPVVIPAGVTAKVEGQHVAVKGAKGELEIHRARRGVGQARRRRACT